MDWSYSQAMFLESKFGQVSAGEEGIAVGSASALIPEDVIFAQYRETGVFQQRGFTLEDFMSQLFANNKDPGRGRNMPVHYGSSKLNIVALQVPPRVAENKCTHVSVAHNFLPPCDANSSSSWSSLCSQTSSSPNPLYDTSSSRLLLRRRRGQ